MNKVALALWVSLVLYTIMYLFFIHAKSPLLFDILNGEADAFASHFFNLMGLVPFYFLSDYVLFQPRRKLAILPFLLGFLGGAFSILIGYTAKITTHNRPRHLGLLLVLLIIVTGTMIALAVGLGQPQLFFSHFFQDSLVGIMTVDFLVLYIWSIFRSKQLFKHWYIAFIPMMGFGLLMLLNQRR